VLVVEDRLWRGAPGTAVESIAAGTASPLQPLWLVDVLRGVVDASGRTQEALDGHNCSAFSAHADLNRAAAALPYRLAIPAAARQLEDLEQIRVELWVDDDGFIRRIRHTSTGRDAGTTTATVDLTDFAVELPTDWSRLPSHPPCQIPALREWPPRPRCDRRSR